MEKCFDDLAGDLDYLAANFPNTDPGFTGISTTPYSSHREVERTVVVVED